MATGKQNWRSYAGKFAGAGETRFEDFEEFPVKLPDTEELLLSVHAAAAAAEGAGPQSDWHDRLDKQRRQLERVREQWKRRDETRREDLVVAWAAQLAADRARKELARAKLHQRLQAEADKVRRAQRRAARALQTSQDDSTFLTGVLPSSVMTGESVSAGPSLALPEIPASVRVPVLSQDRTVKWSQDRRPDRQKKGGLPPEARGRKAKTLVRKSTGDQQGLPDIQSMFQGLKRTELGQEQVEEVAVQAPIPRKNQLRRAQLKLMRQLSESMGVYRKQMMQRLGAIAEIADLQYDDDEGRRKHKTWTGVPMLDKGMLLR